MVGVVDVIDWRVGSWVVGVVLGWAVIEVVSCHLIVVGVVEVVYLVELWEVNVRVIDVRNDWSRRELWVTHVVRVVVLWNLPGWYVVVDVVPGVRDMVVGVGVGD